MGEEVREVRRRDDPDDRAVLDDRQPLDDLLAHARGSVLDAGVGPDGDKRRGHDVGDGRRLRVRPRGQQLRQVVLGEDADGLAVPADHERADAGVDQLAGGGTAVASGDTVSTRDCITSRTAMGVSITTGSGRTTYQPAVRADSGPGSRRHTRRPSGPVAHPETSTGSPSSVGGATWST